MIALVLGRTQAKRRFGKRTLGVDAVVKDGEPDHELANLDAEKTGIIRLKILRCNLTGVKTCPLIVRLKPRIQFGRYLLRVRTGRIVTILRILPLATATTIPSPVAGRAQKTWILCLRFLELP